MKKKMCKQLVPLKIISLFFLLSCSFFHKVEDTGDYDVKMMRACEQYVLNYSPLYVVNGETVNVAYFNIVPDSINCYLINCARANNFRPLKYAAALIIRQQREYLLRNSPEPMIMDALVQKNGFIVLIRQAMKIGNIDDNFTSMNYYPIYIGDACKWINDNKKNIDDFKFIDKQKYKKIE